MDEINFTCDKLFILHFSSFVTILFLFRPYQLMGLKRQVILVCCFGYCLQASYIITLQALGISHSKQSTLQLIPVIFINVVSLCLQLYFVTNHFCIGRTRRSQVKFFLQMTAFPISLVILAVPVAQIIHPAYNKEDKDGKLLIALFSPLTGVLLKVISWVSVRRLCSKSIHSGYSYVLLRPLCLSNRIKMSYVEFQYLSPNYNVYIQMVMYV